MPRVNQEEKEQKEQFKVILVGDGTVGKTSICNRFAHGHFAAHYKQTIGLDFFVRRMQLPDETDVVLQLWDIGGQSLSSKMMKSYIAGAHAVLLCYDITNYDSFANLADWYALVDGVPYVALLGNKCDLSHIRAVKGAEHTKFAEKHHLAKFLMSAKTADQVHSCFLQGRNQAGIQSVSCVLEVVIILVEAK